MFAEIGENCYIEPPLYANWGGRYVHFGRDVYANFHLTLVDDTHIYVGDGVLFGPNVTVTTGTHPIHPELRRQQAQYNVPVHIGSNVWIGANVEQRVHPFAGQGIDAEDRFAARQPQPALRPIGVSRPAGRSG